MLFPRAHSLALVTAIGAGDDSFSFSLPNDERAALSSPWMRAARRRGTLLRKPLLCSNGMLLCFLHSGMLLYLFLPNGIRRFLHSGMLLHWFLFSGMLLRRTSLEVAHALDHDLLLPFPDILGVGIAFSRLLLEV
ncbi:hypothetical protein GW17_00042710 [Ensete ventricosum]|nr:hypothetical protein GW17_00042710 [Ensete ventricosum]